MDKKSLLSAFLTAILIGGLVLAGSMHFGTIQASTDVNGIPKPSVPEFTHVTKESFSLVPGSIVLIQIQLQKDDQVEGSFIVNNFHYYPNVFNDGELITYSVDVKVSDSKYQTLYDFYPAIEGSFNFTALYSGVYTIPCSCSYIYLANNPIAPLLTINFTVGGIPMEVNILSPLSQTYGESNVSLSYTVNRFGDWTGYSLDGKDNVTLWDIDNGTPMSYGNTTLTGLSNGLHTVTVYANDTYGNMDGKTITFTVEKIETFSATTIAIIAFIIIIVATLSVALYRRHRKTTT